MHCTSSQYIHDFIFALCSIIPYGNSAGSGEQLRARETVSQIPRFFALDPGLDPFVVSVCVVFLFYLVFLRIYTLYEYTIESVAHTLYYIYCTHIMHPLYPYTYTLGCSASVNIRSVMLISCCLQTW